MQFYVGLHQPSDAQHFEHCFISINRLRMRNKNFKAHHWILDSGAFTELEKYGHYRHSAEVYAREVDRWTWCAKLDRVVSQDYMCEPFMLEKTGLTVAEHQRLTIERFDTIRACVRYAKLMPVLQGYTPQEYVDHIRQYGDRLTPGMWVGVGSVCKRNGDPRAIEAVLTAIKIERPDLRLHGFGLKKTAFSSPIVVDCLHSADSMAWSLAARKARFAGDMTRNANDWREARDYITGMNL